MCTCIHTGVPGLVCVSERAQVGLVQGRRYKTRDPSPRLVPRYSICLALTSPERRVMWAGEGRGTGGGMFTLLTPGLYYVVFCGRCGGPATEDRSCTLMKRVFLFIFLCILLASVISDLASYVCG